ncbi:MAG TPA: DNA-binding transcriptional regulator [Phycisphaeraceae bacterium]
MATRSRRADGARHVALAVPMGVAHLQPLVRGITDFARSHGRWIFTTSPETVTLSVQSLRGWRGDGVIAVLLNQADVRAARRLGMPVVTISGALRHPGFPRIMVDHGAVGRMAAEHLLACGFRRFGYYGLRSVAYAQDRGAGFQQVIQERLGPGRCVVHFSPNAFTVSHPWQDEMERLERWIDSLEPPMGLFAANDHRARMLVDACRRLGLRVPEDFGVLGVDNDLVVCQFSDPPLSSIACDWYQIGQGAAALLDRLMAGQAVEEGDRLVGPVGVVRRRSTDVLVVEHPGVERAVRYIREHLSEPFGIGCLLEQVRVSRRSLELGFKQSLGCTPYEFLCRARVARAKDLLAAPKRMKLSEVAAACGFTDLRRFRLVFTRCEGITPAEYRRRLVIPPRSSGTDYEPPGVPATDHGLYTPASTRAR